MRARSCLIRSTTKCICNSQRNLVKGRDQKMFMGSIYRKDEEEEEPKSKSKGIGLSVKFRSYKQMIYNMLITHVNNVL